MMIRRIILLGLVMLFMIEPIDVFAYYEKRLSEEQMDRDSAQADILSRIEEKYARKCSIISFTHEEDDLFGVRDIARICFEDARNDVFYATRMGDGTLLDTYPLVEFAPVYASAIKEMASDFFGGTEVYVSAMVAANLFSKDYGAEVTYDELLSSERLRISVWLLLPEGGEAEYSRLASLTEALVAKGFYGTYACCFVNDAEAALKIAQENHDVESSLFHAGVMRAYTDFAINQDDPKPATLASLEEREIRRQVRINDIFAVQPFDRYAGRMKMRDPGEYVHHFDGLDRIGDVYAFNIAGEGRLIVDLAALGAQGRRVRMVSIAWDYDAQQYHIVYPDGVIRENMLTLFEIPRLPFCFIGVDETEASDG